MNIRKLFLFGFIIIAVLCFSGCSEDMENLETEKGLSEIRFLENQCCNIFEKYMGGDYSTEDNQIQWNLLKEDYVVLKDAMDVILIDMASLQIQSKSIVALENHFNDLDNDIRMKEGNLWIKEICDIYYLLSNTILESISKEEWVQQEKKCKSDLLYVGYYLILWQKEEVLASLDAFEEKFADLNKNQAYLENNAYKVNKVFMSIQKLKLSLERDNLEAGKEEFLKLLKMF